MKGKRCLRTEAAIEELAPLIERARADGLRIGWLALEEPTVPPQVGSVLEAGATRCVVAGARRTLAAQTRHGGAVFDDLLRQHFLGCDVVLVRGEIELPALQRQGAEWCVVQLDGRSTRLDLEQMVAWLQRPSTDRVAG